MNAQRQLLWARNLVIVIFSLSKRTRLGRNFPSQLTEEEPGVPGDQHLAKSDSKAVLFLLYDRVGIRL